MTGAQVQLEDGDWPKVNVSDDGRLGSFKLTQADLDAAAAGLGPIDPIGDKMKEIQYPDYVQLHLKASTEIKFKRWKQAAEFLRKAISINPVFIPSLVDYGIVLNKLGQHQQAIAQLESVIQIAPKVAKVYHNLAVLHASREEFGTAAALSAQAAVLEPRNARMVWDRCGYFLSLGDFERGWLNSEARLAANGFTLIRPAPPPAWNGELLLGEKIIVWSEQGIGEEIMFLPMLQQLVDAGAEVTFECDERMFGLVSRSYPKLHLVARDKKRMTWAVPKPEEFSYQLPLGNLGAHFRKSWDQFPQHSGYLKSDPELVAEFRKKYDEMANGRPIIGLAWKSHHPLHGDPKNVPADDMRKSMDGIDALFVSLQYGDVAVDSFMLGDTVYFDETVDTVGDMDRVAAQIAAMDFVVTTSQTCVHLAGGMNIPTALLVPPGLARHWYWFLRRMDCPWYPSVLLFRPNPTKTPWWDSPLARLKQYISGVLSAQSQNNPISEK